MITLGTHAPPHRSRFAISVLAVLLVLAFAAFGAGRASALTTAANCALPGSNFQGGDGNQNTPSVAEEAFCTEHLLPTTRDWQSLNGVINSPDPQAQDSMFAGGNKESAPGGWGLISAAGGVTPGKANILSGWSQADPQAAATFLYLAFEREATTGDTFLTFELNQVKGLWENEKKAVIPCRTTGDVLIAYNVPGGLSVNVVVYRWVTDTSTLTTIPPDPTPHACAKTGHFEPSEGTPVSAPSEQGAMSTVETTNFLTDTANPPTPKTFAAGSFGEAALNLTAIFENANLGSCFAFGQMWMSSRSSESIDSQLQDYVGPVGIQADSCAISGRKFDDANGSGVDSPSKPGLGGWTIQLLDSTGAHVLRTTTTASDGTYTFTNVPPGSYILREVAQSGWTCDYPGTGSNCQNSVTLSTTNVNSTGNDFGNKPTSTVQTTQEPSSAVVGSKFGDSATVSGPGGTPTSTGTVEFRLYSDNHCGTLVAGPILETLSGGSASIPDASKVTPSAGEYWWVATYGGDSGNASASSGCADEPVVINPAKPAIKTTQQPASATVGQTVKDKATLSGLFGEHPAGKVSWKLYNNENCTSANGGLIASEGPVDVNGNGDYETPGGASPTQAGSYYWVATYSGDQNNTEVASGCADEPVVINPAKPAIKTTQQPASATVGQTVKDKATLSGLFGEHPAGKVSWKLYNNENCTSANGGLIASEGPVDVNGNGDYETPGGASPTQAGSYYWVATYSGDQNNTEVASGCADEPVVINPAKPAIKTTQQPASATVGQTVKDKATLSGLFGEHPAGKVSWKLYNNENCTSANGGLIASEGPVDVNGNGDYETPGGASPTQAGSYYWVATYSGDQNNTEVASGCADEPVVINPAKPAIKTTQQPASATVGQTVKDKATLSGLFGEHPAGKVSWKLYNNENCTSANGGLIASEGPVDVNGNGDYETPGGASPTQAGSYYWVATYSGDQNNTEVASGCADEPVVINPAKPAIKTTQQPASATVGQTVKDKATLSGLFGEHPAGKVSWKLYNNENCTSANGGLIASEGPVDVNGNGDYETPGGASPTQAGSYYWVATYSGDQNNTEVASGCADEPVVINPAPAPSPPPSVAVLSARIVSGLAAPHGPAACVARTTPVYVTGRQIVSGTFYLDGHKVKTMIKADKSGRYGIKVNTSKLGFGVHRVKVVVVFAASSQTKTKTFRVLIFRCRPPRPKFTG